MDVDHFVATHGGRADVPLSLIGGLLDGRASSSLHGRPSFAQVQERLREGATLRIGNTTAWLPEVRRLAARFEQALSSDIAINLYLTPPQARAFGAHYDNHDVFVLQIEGQKRWRLREPAADSPLETVFRGRDAWLRRPLPYETSLKTLPPMTAEREVVLRAGDLLYVPRGHVHQVTTGDCSSLHLTVAAPVVTWYEVVVHALIAAAGREPALRAALPPGFASDTDVRKRLTGEAPAIVAAVTSALRPADLTASVATLADLFALSREGDWSGLTRDMAATDALALDAVLAVRSGMVCARRASGADLLLMFAGRSLRVPIRAETMVDHILDRRRFRVAELPTHLGDESRLVLARTLLENGLLTFADGR